MLISFFLMMIISTSLTVRGQPRFHVEALLPFRNCEMDYWYCELLVIPKAGEVIFKILKTNFWYFLNAIAS